MTCPHCGGPIELPEYRQPAWCPACDVLFHMTDYGWFRVGGMEWTTAEVYEAEDE